MKLLLCVQSWSGANEALERHWPYFLNAGASRIVGIGTDGSRNDPPTLAKCVFPQGVEQVIIGDDRYMWGDNVVRRLLHTVLWCLDQPDYDHFCIAEYDSVFFHPIPEFSGLGGYHAGGKTWGSKGSNGFYHNPWFFDRDSGMALSRQMASIIAEGHCTYGSPESSPDVFFAWAAERSGIEVKAVLKEYSRNNLDTRHYLNEARHAVKDGAHVIHGVKTKEQLDYITAKEVPNDFLDTGGILLATAFTQDYKRAEQYVESLHKHCNVPVQLLVIPRDMPDYGMPRSIVQGGQFLRHIGRCRTIIFTDADIIMHRPLESDEVDFLNSLDEGQISACHNKGQWQSWAEEVPMLNPRKPMHGFEGVKVFNTGFVACRTATYAALFERFKVLWPQFDEAYEHYAKIQLCLCAAVHQLGFKWVPMPGHICSQGHFGPAPGVDCHARPPTFNGRVIAFDHRISH